MLLQLQAQLIIIINSHSKVVLLHALRTKTIIIYGQAVRVHVRLVNLYLLNVPSVSSPYFNKIKRTSHLGKWHALSLEILSSPHNICLFFSCFLKLPYA